MGSGEDLSGMQLEGSMDSSWTHAAYGAVQAITAALQSGVDDVQRVDDAPSFQVLCEAARQACCQAESSINSAAQHAGALHPKDLDCFCQLSTATLQLSSAICCDPAVALPLISCGTHTPALDQLKGAVKALTNMWGLCMEHLMQQGSLQQGGALSGSQQAWQCVIVPALATSVKHLLHMAVTQSQAEFVSSSSSSNNGSSQQVPKEMCSMSALNLSWANLTRLLVAVPADVRQQVLEAQDLLHGLRCALQQLHAAVMGLPVQPRERQEVLVRFWLQSVSRLTSAVWEDAACQALQPLLAVTSDVFAVVVQQRQEFEAVQDILQNLLQPRLLACLSTLLSASKDTAALQPKLDVLLQHPTMPNGSPSQQHQHQHQDLQQQQQQQERLMAQVYVVLAILQGYVPSWPQDLIAPGCKQLLSWTVSTTSQELAASVLSPAAAGPAQQEGQGSSSSDAAGLQLMQDILQGCLAGVVVCWGLLQDMQQQQLELLATVNTLALSAHPLVSFLGRQLQADLVAAAGSSDLALQELGVLRQLLGASAAAAAVPGAAPWGADSGAEAVVDALAAILQACDEGFAREWLRQHIMRGISSSNSSSSSSQWLDAGACALLAQESALLQCLAGTPQLVPVGLPQLQEAWTQLWSTAQQVAELLEPQHLQQLQRPSSGSSGGGGVATQRQAETLLVLHQLTWLFAAMQAVLQLCGTLDFAAASSLKQEALETALDVLRAVSEGCGRPDSASTSSSTYSVAAAQYACTSAVLGLLAVPGQLSLAEGQTQQLLSVLAGLAGQQHERLHVVLAGVLGSLGVTAKSGQQVYQELFQQLILGPHWAVKHASFEALLQLLRHGDLGSGIMTLLPPALKLSATSAVPEVVTTVRAHLQKQPDPQAQTCFAQQYPQLAVQHMQQLAAQAAQGSRTAAAQQYAACGPAALLDPSRLSAHLQGLQDLLAACGEAAVSAGCDNTRGAASTAVGVCHVGFAHPADTCAAPPHVAQCPDGGADGAKALLVQAAVASRSLQAAQQALAAAEADVRLLLDAAAAASRDKTLGPDGILLVSKQGKFLNGSVASMTSRLRALGDELSRLK